MVNEPHCFHFNGITYPSQLAFIESGARCSTPTPSRFARNRIRKVLAEIPNEALSLEALTISITWHIIDDRARDGQINEQVKTLNAAFGPSITFVSTSISRVNEPRWLNLELRSRQEKEMKKQLSVDPLKQLNIYVTTIAGGSLGNSSWPWDLDYQPEYDGVILDTNALPGGLAPYNLGKTAVHEAGHWLGLYHTFQEGCNPPGDEIEDTPAEATPAFGRLDQNRGRDTCPDQDGLDPVTNYMDYTDDEALVEFTPLQLQRVSKCILAYRKELLSSIFYRESAFDSCFEDREIVSHDKNKTGRLIRISDVFVVKADHNNALLETCSVASLSRHYEGHRVLYSGFYMQVFPEERRISLPFRFTDFWVYREPASPLYR